ncbi:hypothetical protein [Xanthobacter sediminis]|uniref:hypothetical protein n=1 Tax=Xanthobacter sediminis TaxID=3119926 RepID=UPI003727436E
MAQLAQYQDYQKYANVQWKRLPPGVGFQPTEAMKAEIAARKAEAARTEAEWKSQHEANPELYSNNVESHTMYETNVATLPEDQVGPRIEYITNLIQSGEADNYSFRAGNGEKTTTSIHQFLYWLQQRTQDLNSDGTYSPEMLARRALPSDTSK